MQVLVRKMKINTLWILLLGFTCFAFCGSSLAQEPQGIFLPENSRLVWAVVGEGVQIYDAKSNPAGGYKWALKGPEAELKEYLASLLGSILLGRVGRLTMEARSRVLCRL